MSIRRRERDLSWHEGEILHLEGGLVGDHGIQWYDPSPPGASYASLIYRASGGILGRAVELTKREFDLLAFLAANPRRVYSRQELLSQAVSDEAAAFDPFQVYRDMYPGNGAGPIDKAMYLDQRTWLPDTYLEKVDKASMATGLEARSPFLDHSLMTFAAQLPASLKMPGRRTKALLRRAIADEGIEVLTGEELGDPSKKAWAEYGNIDEVGHSQVNRFAPAVQNQVLDLCDRIHELVNHGWKRVRVVTDHGWLYLPDGLEKAELAQHLTDLRKGRAARLSKTTTEISHPRVKWRWDPNVTIAMAPGLTCPASSSTGRSWSV